MDLKKVHIQDIDTEFLRLNTGRPVFVLDDFLKEGTP